MKKRTALLLSLSATAAFLLFLLGQALFFAPAGVSVRPDRTAAVEEARLDLNRAAADELRRLPGLGPALSEAIVTWREEHGAFRSVDELTEVSGIGQKTLEALRDYVYVQGADPGPDPGHS